MSNYIDKDELVAAIIKIQSDPNADKTEFVKLCLLVIHNLRRRTNFSQYTTNWTEDYTSNAIYKMLKYIHNFNPNRISTITGEKVSAFAYLTQIAKAAFFEVINKRKKEEIGIKDRIQMHELEYSINNPTREHTNYSTYEPEDTNEIKSYNMSRMSLEGNKFQSIYDVLKFLKDRGETHVKLVYPKKYMVNMDEYNQICTINFEYLDLTRKSYKPKKEELLEISPTGIDEFDEFWTDVDEWSQYVDNDITDEDISDLMSITVDDTKED